jgi:hypothetical protein
MSEREPLVDTEGYLAEMQKPLALHHQIGEDNKALNPQIDIVIDSKRNFISIIQGERVVFVSKWQALELAKELLNNRDMLSNPNQMESTQS